MKTPLSDFISEYCKKDPFRLHMPGHKGIGPMGIESQDLTEVIGADVLYHESSILAESQQNAAHLFDTAKTLYSTEGSTLCIRAMLTLAVQHARSEGRKPVIAAGRNAHKAFWTSCAMLDLNPIPISVGSSLLSSCVTPSALERLFSESKETPTAVYVTSPDYLGCISDIQGLARVCKENGALLLVDNAHGAYLHFLPESFHPIHLGADLACDSAHKTLPVLTGAAYLHISHTAPQSILNGAERVMSCFASTSPSYLILQSLDRCNAYLHRGFREALADFIPRKEALEKEIRRLGIPTEGNEPLKITLKPKFIGYTGNELAEILRNNGFECEFSDPDYLVLMLSPCGKSPLLPLKEFFTSLVIKEPLISFPPKAPRTKRVLSLREAFLSPAETVPVNRALGRIAADPATHCPPAIPVIVFGEAIDHDAIQALSYYGVEKISVIKEK